MQYPIFPEKKKIVVDARKKKNEQKGKKINSQGKRYLSFSNSFLNPTHHLLPTQPEHLLYQNIRR